jgi:hypothetical protein
MYNKLLNHNHNTFDITSKRYLFVTLVHTRSHHTYTSDLQTASKAKSNIKNENHQQYIFNI